MEINVMILNDDRRFFDGIADNLKQDPEVVVTEASTIKQYRESTAYAVLDVIFGTTDFDNAAPITENQEKGRRATIMLINPNEIADPVEQIHAMINSRGGFTNLIREAISIKKRGKDHLISPICTHYTPRILQAHILRQSSPLSANNSPPNSEPNQHTFPELKPKVFFYRPEE